MKIEVTNIGRLANGSYMANVIVFDADSKAEAVQAIESTGSQDMEMKVGILEGINAELREKNKTLKEDFDFASDAWRKGKKRITELQEENETLMHNNRELQSQINHLGNSITKALYRTSYVPF